MLTLMQPDYSGDLEQDIFIPVQYDFSDDENLFIPVQLDFHADQKQQDAKRKKKKNKKRKQQKRKQSQEIAEVLDAAVKETQKMCEKHLTDSLKCRHYIKSLLQCLQREIKDPREEDNAQAWYCMARAVHHMAKKVNLLPMDDQMTNVKKIEELKKIVNEVDKCKENTLMQLMVGYLEELEEFTHQPALIDETIRLQLTYTRYYQKLLMDDIPIILINYIESLKRVNFFKRYDSKSHPVIAMYFQRCMSQFIPALEWVLPYKDMCEAGLVPPKPEKLLQFTGKFIMYAMVWTYCNRFNLFGAFFEAEDGGVNYYWVVYNRLERTWWTKLHEKMKA
jgi:hypothetical protein